MILFFIIVIVLSSLFIRPWGMRYRHYPMFMYRPMYRRHMMHRPMCGPRGGFHRHF